MASMSREASACVLFGSSQLLILAAVSVVEAACASLLRFFVKRCLAWALAATPRS